MLDHLVDDVDGVDHIALVLCAETSPDVYDPVALARMVRYADVTDAADLAVTVKDEWQGRGVATVLLEVLMRRRPAGRGPHRHRGAAGQPGVTGDAPPPRRAVSLEDEGNGVYGVVVELEPLTVASRPRRRT